MWEMGPEVIAVPLQLLSTLPLPLPYIHPGNAAGEQSVGWAAIRLVLKLNTNNGCRPDSYTKIQPPNNNEFDM